MNFVQIDEQTAIRNFDDDQRKVISRRRRHIDPEAQERKQGWIDTIIRTQATHAVSLAFNPQYGGTSSTAYRLNLSGRRIAIRGTGSTSKENCLPVLLDISPELVRVEVARLHCRVDRELLKTRNYNRIPIEQRTGYIGFVERVGSNIHCHLAWRVPVAHHSEFDNVLKKRWARLRPYGDAYIKPIHDERGWAEYISKDQWAVPRAEDAALLLASHTISL